MEAKRYSFFPVDVSQQLSLYSISESKEEMYKQCHRIQKNFLEIFNQIELPIVTSLNLLEGRKEHSTFYECWGATVGEIHPFKVDEYYVVKASIDITQIVDSFIWVNYSPRGFYLPEIVAPFEYAIVNSDLPGLKEQAKKLHRELSKHGVRVLWDNRDILYDKKLEFIYMLGINRIILLDETTCTSKEDLTFKIIDRSASKVTITTIEEILNNSKKAAQ
jgi:prolyl-tRNA synthetase